MRRFSSVLFVASLLLLTACPGGVPGIGGETTTANVTMGQVASGLAQFEGHEMMDILAAEPVTYEQTGNGTYDSFFQESAIVYASVVTADGLAAVVEQELNTIADSFGVPPSDDVVDRIQSVVTGGNALDSTQVAKLQTMEMALEAVQTSLEVAPANGETLVGQAPGLVTGATDAFSSDPLMVGPVSSALDDSQSNLTDAVERLPSVVERVGTLAIALSSLASM